MTVTVVVVVAVSVAYMENRSEAVPLHWVNARSGGERITRGERSRERPLGCESYRACLSRCRGDRWSGDCCDRRGARWLSKTALEING